jgi:FtsH-binding integral membrane protein
MRQVMQQTVSCSLLVLSIYLLLNVFVEIPPYHDEGMTKAVVFSAAVVFLLGAYAVHPKWALWQITNEVLRWVVVALLVILTLSVFLPALFCERAAKLLQRTKR